MNDRRRGILLATGGMLGLSTDSLFTRVADADAYDIVFWVGVLLAGVMLSAVFVVDRTTPAAILRRDGSPLLIAGILQACAATFFVLAIKNTSVSNVAVILAAAPLAAAVIGWLWLRERPSARVWFAILMSIAGIGVVISGSIGGGRLTGDLFALCTILAFGVYVVVLRGHPGVSRTMVIGISGVVMAAASLWTATLTGHSLQTWLAIIAMGAVFGPLARLMLLSAPRYLPAAEVALFAPVETVMASLWAFVFFAEAPSSQTWLGGVIVVAGVLWGIWPRRAAEEAVSASA